MVRSKQNLDYETRPILQYGPQIHNQSSAYSFSQRHVARVCTSANISNVRVLSMGRPDDNRRCADITDLHACWNGIVWKHFRPPCAQTICWTHTGLEPKSPTLHIINPLKPGDFCMHRQFPSSWILHFAHNVFTRTHVPHNKLSVLPRTVLQWSVFIIEVFTARYELGL